MADVIANARGETTVVFAHGLVMGVPRGHYLHLDERDAPIDLFVEHLDG